MEQAYSIGLKNPQEIVGKTDFDIFATREQALVFWNNDQEVIRTGAPKIVEEPAVYHGKEYIMLSHKIPLRDEYGNINGILGVSLDITERKNLENALRSGQKRLEEAEQTIIELRKEITGIKVNTKQTIGENVKEALAFLENIIAKIPGHVYWKDKKGNYLGCNQEQAKALGLSSPKEIINQKPYAKLPAEEAKRLRAIDREVMNTGKEKIVEELGVRGDNTQGIFLTHKAPLKNEENEIIGLLGISLDITDRKRMEDELKKAKEKTEVADRIKFDFISNMEHDIRTPIIGMMGVAKVLIPKENDPEKKELLTLMGRGAQELMDYCNVILNFSKMESSHPPVQEKKIDLKRLILRVINLENATAKLKRINLIFDYSKNAPTILFVDEFRLYRILMNLIGNALKFTEKGFVRISVNIAKQVNTKEVILKFMIEDTGVGIPKQQQDYIFEKFAKLTPSNTGYYRSSPGLGLTIVKEFIEDLGGNIELDSQLGRGTKFVLTLPFRLPLVEEVLV